MDDRPKLPVSFPNDPYPITIPFDVDDFNIVSIIGGVAFGWYGDIYVNIETKHLPESKLTDS